jgi:hypothetical protein
VEHGDRKDGRWTVAGGVELGDALDEARALAPQQELKDPHSHSHFPGRSNTTRLT